MKKNNAQSIGNPLPLRIMRNVYPILEKIIPGLAFQAAFRLFFTPIRYDTPKRELPVLEKADKFSAKINGKRTQFYSWGDKGKPLAIVVHGWMGRSSQFYKLIDAFLAKDYHVVGFDGPAHGGSSGRSTNIMEFAEAINIISEKFGAIHCALGHSYGGITILNALEKGTKIENIIMVATPTIAGDIIKQFEEKINASPATGERFLKEVHKRYGITFEYMSASEIIKRVQPKNLLLVHDENDRDVPIEHAKLMKERFPKAQTIFTEGLGHTRILRNDDVIKQIIEISNHCLDQAPLSS
jgi:pimeloyl-ACP methyl ester carboxylesterase